MFSRKKTLKQLSTDSLTSSHMTQWLSDERLKYETYVKQIWHLMNSEVVAVIVCLL